MEEFVDAGKKERIFLKEDLKGVEIYSCPNNISVLTNPTNKSLEIYCQEGQKIKRNTNFIKIENELISFSFPFKVIEIDKENKEYFMIILKVKK
ncbi:hypothetical protein TUBRATIS_30240 [Tubulinosema ratisbonensis]|uniref:Uncharacterized protein n=1 Tax=Tubulinosema ratisbonensis TaxID=291195 RepID=A0A437AHD9_9MICR|nr:hypothetical protein TUBRATIS_30240 [Tubulinosema ratisbonensis]